MDSLSLLIDLHRDGVRQGPGGAAETRRAIALSGLHETTGLRIADIGCGTGASTLVLAKELDAEIIAVDRAADFLTELERRAQREAVGERIRSVAASMEDLSFEAESLDAIWSEGAIYNMGFENGIRAWRRFLKPGGVIAVSDLTWLTAERPAALDDHWNRAYPEVATASAKLALLETHGYSPVGYFPLGRRCWLGNYYRPMQRRFDGFLARHNSSEAARAIVEAEQFEIDLYERFAIFVSYGFYLARKLPD